MPKALIYFDCKEPSKLVGWENVTQQHEAGCSSLDNQIQKIPGTFQSSLAPLALSQYRDRGHFPGLEELGMVSP